MTDEMLFKQLEFVRNRLIATFDSINEEISSEVPAGFNNNIHWNLGHIYVSLDNLMYSFIGETPPIDEKYVSLFNRNTSPADWNGDVPSITELKEVLSEQTSRIIEEFSGKLHVEGEKSFNLGTLELKTVGEVLSFAIWHEGLHLGTISSLIKILSVNK